jgi:hypothetical protein
LRLNQTKGVIIRRTRCHKLGFFTSWDITLLHVKILNLTMIYAFLNSSSEFETLRTALITSIIWFCLRCMTGTRCKQLLQIGSVGQTEADKIVATALDCVPDSPILSRNAGNINETMNSHCGQISLPL